jgi:hypothetical protein
MVGVFSFKPEIIMGEFMGPSEVVLEPAVLPKGRAGGKIRHPSRELGIAINNFPSIAAVENKSLQDEFKTYARIFKKILVGRDTDEACRELKKLSQKLSYNYDVNIIDKKLPSLRIDVMEYFLKSRYPNFALLPEVVVAGSEADKLVQYGKELCVVAFVKNFMSGIASIHADRAENILSGMDKKEKNISEAIKVVKAAVKRCYKERNAPVTNYRGLGSA